MVKNDYHTLFDGGNPAVKSKKYLEKRLASVQDSRLKRYVTVVKVRIMENGGLEQ